MMLLLLLLLLALALQFQFFVFAVAALAGADGALEGFFVYYAFVGKGFEDGFVLLALATLGGCFVVCTCAILPVAVCRHGAVFGAVAVAVAAARMVAGERSGSTEILPRGG